MIGIEEQIDLLKLIGTEMKKQTECVIIGGSAMLFYGLKSATKDVDIVFFSESDRKAFIRTAEDIGFGQINRIGDYKAGTPVIMERKNARMDLFINEIVSFRLSPGIMSRIKEKHEFGKLTADIISPEDIILLKCATDRAGDRKDASDLIAKFPINWDSIINESAWQTQNGKKVFSVFLFDFLEELKETYKAEIPNGIIRKTRKLAETEMMKALGKNKIADLERFSPEPKQR
ncbi:MAG: nucleotidyltransferase [Candidatus Aenigmarchaeota archaeon]|nr:nucleotidyltransferase [Candidatus Aenigmarchaeota archaeon]